MTTAPTTANSSPAKARRMKTFVIAEGIAYEASSQRFVDAYLGFRGEPALANRVVRYFTAVQTTDGEVRSDRGGVAAFDARGIARNDLAELAMATLTHGKTLRELATSRGITDPQAIAFLDLSEQNVAIEAMHELARTARPLTTQANALAQHA